MYKTIKQTLLSILLIVTLSMSHASASVLTDKQIHAVLSIITTFITSSSSKNIALKKVSNYASSNGASGTPTLGDYTDTGVTKVDARILVAVNEAVALTTASSVATTTQLQALVNQVLLKAPVITLNGNSNVSLGLNSTYIEYNATAIDNIDGDISVNIEINGTVDTAVAGTYTVTYNVKDDDNNSATEVNRTVVIDTIIDILPPVIVGVASDYNVSVDENQLSAIDINATDTYTISYSIQDGNSSYFNIDVATGVVTFKVAPDYESGFIVYTFTAVASDGSGTDTTIAVTININNVDEIPPVFISDANVTVDENTRIAIDLNAIGTLSYSISGNDNLLFEVNASTGVVSFLTLPDYEATPTKHTYTFVATASDGLNTTNQTIIITINDINDESPIWSIDGNVTVDEEQSTAITLIATDKDANTNLVYSIQDANSSYFDVNSSTGLVSFKALPDYESGIIIYTFTGKVSDGVNTSTLAVTINLNEIFETQLKKTEQNLSYDSLGVNIVDNSLEDDAFYKKGQITVYSRNAAGVVTDHITRLEWQDNVFSVSKKWVIDISNPTVTTGDTAFTYCDTLVLDSKEDWRLPTYTELESLIHYGNTSPSTIFDSIFLNEEPGSYWTSTLYVDTVNQTTHTWIIRSDGGDDNQLSRENFGYVMCVRNQ